MSITPHRDAAVSTVAEARNHFARLGPADPVTMIARRMDVDITEAVMLGYGDLRDIATHQVTCGGIIIRTLASALASFIATVCGGEQAAVRRLLDAALLDLRERTLERIAVIPTQGISAPVGRSEPRGHA